MMRAAFLLAGLSALAVPAAAQQGHGAHHPPAAEEPAPSPPHVAADASCSPEHAAMGHCTLPAAPSQAPDGAVGTDLPPGNAPAPPPPGDWYADRLFPAEDIAHARHEMMKEGGGQTFGFVRIDFEYQARKGRDGYDWDGEAWYGGDINRLTIKSEGEGAFGEGVEDAEIQLLYSRAVDPYFNAQAGIRQDIGRGPARTYAAIGFEGLAPYWFEVEGTAFVSDKGDVLGRFEAEYDQRITQRLVLQPAAEIGFALQDVPESGIGSGISNLELGLRLRYEIVKEIAPYIGVEWSRSLGETARLARAAGEGASKVRFVVGLRTWF